ncbi:hypothetical protein BDV59DRAFT_177758 [Aspergillus ambiguus]|uniref:uncharacterized protein n=1 Tax=Aspergillus ambiguus TaxID=176160 RepID=UPI003CCD2559
MAKQTVNSNSVLSPDGSPSIVHSTVDRCTFDCLTPADTIRRSKLSGVCISSKSISNGTINRDNRTATQTRTTNIHRSHISNSAMACVSARRSTITNSTLTNVASARYLDAQGSHFENVRSVRRSTIKNSNAAGNSSIARSTVHDSVITDGSSVSRSTLNSVRVIASHVKRSTLRDCDIKNCIIHRTNFKGAILQNEVWKNGRLVGRIRGNNQDGQVCFVIDEAIFLMC